MKNLVLILYLSISSSLIAQIVTTGTQTLLPGFTTNIEIDGNTFTTKLILSGPSNVWLAIGFGNSEMNGTDIFMTNGSTIRDAFSEPGPSSSLERPVPAQDSPGNESGDWNLVSNTVTEGTRTIVATRINNTQDSNDYIFDVTASSLSVIYAHGGTSNYAWHGPDNRGATDLAINTLSYEENKFLSFDISPNPVSDLLNIKLPTVTKNAEVEIFDFTGRLVKSKKISYDDRDLNVKKLSNGIYIIRIATLDKIGYKRFIKK